MSDPQTNSSPETPKRRRWMMPLLVVSLALNLLVLGAVVGRGLAPDGPQKRDRVSGPLRSVIGEPFVQALDKKERRALLKEIGQEAPKIRETREALRTRFEAFLTAVRSDPFDRGVVESLLGEQAETARGRQELGQMLLLNRLTEMTVEERNAYADRLENNLKNLRRR